MKALDTNILARFILRDDPRQAELARDYIAVATAAGELLFLSTPVLCELSWVLEDCYDYNRQEQVVVFEKLLHVAQFTFEDKELLFHALADFAKGPADFADYIIGRIASRYGCTETATFDKALKGEPGYRVLTGR